MPAIVERFFKNLCGNLLHQKYTLLVLCALTRILIVSTELHEASRNISHHLNNVNHTENCEYYKKVIFCRTSDEYCVTVKYMDVLDSNEDYHIEYDVESLFSIICKEQPMDIKRFFAKFPRPLQSKRMELHVKNIPKLPEFLFYGNVSYNVKLEYTSNTDKAINVLHNSINMRELIVHIKSYVLDEKWLGELLRPLNALKLLKITLDSKATDVTLPIDSFHTLNELQELKLYIKSEGGESESAMTMPTTQTSLRNLTREYFRNLHKLRRLYLTGNNMQTLDSDLFSALCELKSLNLRANGLRHLAANLFAAQSKLIFLDLGRNQLEYLPTELFAHTPLLYQLRLDGNRLYAIANILATLKPVNYISMLDLRHNQFVSISHANDSLLSHIDHKPIGDIPDFWKYLKEAYEYVPHLMPILDLSHNHLSNFSWDWITSADVACNIRIKLSSNRIRHLYALTKPVTVAPKCRPILYFDENPLHCDCQLAWFYNLDDFLARATLSTSTTNWFCATPTHLRGRAVRTLRRNDLCEWSASFCPAMCVCTRHNGRDGDDNSAALMINCTATRMNSVLTQLPRPEQVALTQTTLHIERCNFTELPSNVIAGYANVTRLHAAENNITTISVSHLPPNLLLLDLRANNLQRLSVDFLTAYLNESTNLQTLYLSHNPWLCDCEALRLLQTLRTHHARIPDIDQVFCSNRHGEALLRVNLRDICHTRVDVITSIVLPLVAFSLTTFVLLILIALYYKYEIELKIWLYAHNWCLLWISEDELDKNKPFDAFISYAHQQNHYVNHILLPGLEQGQPSFRICIHERNWLAGACIPDQIVKSVEQSCRTIFVLSEHFIESNWGRMEFRTAHQCALNEGRARIIVIKYGELKNLERLDKELQAYLKMNTYLEWNDPRFWQKLRYAMPHRRSIEYGVNTVKVPRRVYIPD